jgi:signal recognition particle receptor subunit beta
MDRLKSSRSTIGGKIESISAVSSGNKGSVFATLLRLFGLGGTSGPTAGAEEDEVAEEDAESLIWGEKDGFKWEDVEGVEIEWAVSGGLLPGNERKSDQSADDTSEDGLKEVRNWLEEM